ncbi:P-loop containing nucleoside triphosphate hydrolase protein [Terfezia boudieri ATCC MYA-4762]|uniref:P-loop containing nucleoside triphosphate hydrolase protein n=1 Tax=Terfezia boudieri ATCC MYA-4762 TaxID=1051890 RepID=A0A3N4L763_9PEZI|nr:P-loop containing nucleoside triphosphate hydrolase protein [Terfezia boudieri ATCC MYA-4762]
MTFWNHCVPFLTVITDEELRSSLVLENAVGTIYTFIYGHSGTRGVPFFSHVADHLSKTTAISRTSAEFGTAVGATASAISMTLTFNQSAAVQKEFVDIGKTLRMCIQAGGIEHAVRFADIEISKVEQKLGVADLIPERREPTKKPTAIPGGLSYLGDVDFPGDLSLNGARHDNDKASIRDIKILPTRGEIMCVTRNEYLPKKDYHPKAHHLPPGIVRILDTQFRLLREDTSGQLRDAIRYTMDALTKSPDKPVKPNGTQVVIYKRVVLERFKAADRDGLQIDVSFDQPQRLTKSKPNALARRKFWLEYKNLQSGALLCLIDQQKKEFSFMIVSERSPEANDRFRGRDKKANENQQEVPLKPHDLADHPTRALVTLKLVDVASDLMAVVKQYHGQLKQTWGGNYVLPYLIEFPGMLLASFEPILRFLQNMILERTVPFSKLLAPEGNSVDNQPSPDPAKPTQIEVPPPLYFTKGNITLDLSVILKDSYKHVSLTHSIRRPCSMAQLQTYTTLDRGQCEALIGGLTRELALIQGPPGTGKSYVGVQLCKILLHNNGKLKLGPIVCVCYTNHALDQFLVDLLESGVERIVRLGSRSKEEKLEPYTLRNVAQKVESTWVERSEIRSLKQLLELSIEEIQDLCSQLSMVHYWRTLRDYLQQHDQAICNQLFGTAFDEEGFEVVSHRKPEQVVDDWVHSRFLQQPIAQAILDRVGRQRTMEQILECRDISLLSSAERVWLKAYWESNITRELLANLQRATAAWKKAQEDLKKMYQERDRRCLHTAQVIGVTTTGLAGQASLLRKLVAKVMVCEEAGEVLEAHTLTAILPSVEHAILIGDHQQLRPHIANYSLSMESRKGEDYALDESLFERLTREKYNLYYTSLQFPFATLDTQRRMHPSISDLIRQTLYPSLKDYPDTHNHPEVQGMARRLFWMNHDHMEANADKSDPGSVSKSNDFEIDMAAALVKHLIKQGKYGKGDIAVLTPYLGQMQRMKKKLGAMFEILVGEKDQEELDRAEGSDEDIQIEVKLPVKPEEVRTGTLLSELRLATVDNFQGEEAKVIVISLVRSNPGRRCGFLKTSNRINVLLSRAKHGMYIIGNADTSRPIEMWSNVLTLLNRQGNFGDALELRCPRHKDKQIFVQNPEDFLRFSPEGGCNEKCRLIHECGHACTFNCHSNMLHKAVVCPGECTRKLPGCEHPCPKPCGSKCAPCKIPISHIFLPCGHTSYNVACHEAQNPGKIICRRSVIKTVPGCGHKLDVGCFFNVTDPKFKCPLACEQNLPCGHKCIAKCHECRAPREDGSKHVQCRSLCEHTFNTCGHSCTKQCHVGTECGICNNPCELRCIHSKCTKKCSDACTPCALQCAWNCIHRGKCNMPCSAPCDMLPCSKRCERILQCGHRCPSVCGEQCPDVRFCQKCAKPEILANVVDKVSMETYNNIELDTNPVIFLSCGHFFCMGTVDGLMQMGDVYEYDKENNIISQKPQKSWIKNIKHSQTRCPSCRGPLTDIFRYNRVAKGVMVEVLTQRFLLTTHRAFLGLEKRLSDIEKELSNMKSLEAEVGKLYGPKPKEAAATDGSKNPILSLIDRRHRRLMELSKATTRYITLVTREEQPYVRIHALVADCIRRNRITDSNYTVDDTSVVLRNRLLGQVLFLRTAWARLYDFLEIHELTALKDKPAEKKRVGKNMLKSLEKLKAGCKQLEKDATTAHQPRQQVEAKLYHAKFVSIELKFSAAPPAPPPNPENYEAAIRDKRETEIQSLREASTICRQYIGSTRGLMLQVEEAEKMVEGLAFPRPVINNETKAAYDAMRADWYYCVNRHPFTIDRYGMPMELARCPQCDAPIGGNDHVTVTGITRVEDLEARFLGMHV